MSTQLSDLIEKLQSQVPARNNVPDDQQYRQAVIDAVDDFSLRASREKITTLQIVSGTASYDLPADFVKLIKLGGIACGDGVLNTNAGLIPLSTSTFAERITISNKVLTITPTPAYSMERQLRYAAGWALTEGGDPDYSDDDIYEDMGPTEARIVLLKAQADCSSLQVNKQSGGILRYSIGDESFDKSSGVESLMKSVESLESRYLAAVDKYNGSLTIQGTP